MYPGATISPAPVVSTPQPSTAAAASPLTPVDTVLLLLDHQPQMFFGAASDDRAEIINATVGLAKAAGDRCHQGDRPLEARDLRAVAEACMAMAALSALEQGYEVCVATNTCAGVTPESP